MSDLEKLLAVVQGIDPEQRTKEESAPTDEELSEARTGLVESLKDAAAGDRPDLEAARAIRSAIDKIDGELVTRDEDRATARKEAEELLKGISEEPKVEASDDSGEGDGEGDANGDAEEGEQAEEAPNAEKEKATVAASLSDALKRSSKRGATAREAAEQRPVADVLVSSVGVAQGFSLPQDATIEDAAKLFDRYAGQVKRGGSVLIHMDKLYPDERALGPSAVENTRRMDAVMGPRAITAAGGICEPLEADFNHPICGDRGRPIRDALPGFRADRGGIRYAPTATLGDLDTAITVWTHQTDETPGSDTKACPRVDCEQELTAQVDAVVACLTVGNFQARFNPEFWRSRLDLLMVTHDRVAEQTLYANIESTSTQVTYTGSTGTTLDVLEAVDKAVAGIGSRNRLLGTGYVTILPEWLRIALREALVGQAPAGSTDLFAVADAQINQFFSARRVNPVWSPDIDVFGAQGAGALDEFSGTVDVVLFPQGAWSFLDGGTLDLGTQIVDSTLNTTNDRQAFMETFEASVQRGCESLSIAVAVSEGCLCAAGVS